MFEDAHAASKTRGRLTAANQAANQATQSPLLLLLNQMTGRARLGSGSFWKLPLVQELAGLTRPLSRDLS